MYVIISPLFRLNLFFGCTYLAVVLSNFSPAISIDGSLDSSCISSPSLSILLIYFLNAKSNVFAFNTNSSRSSSS